MENEMAGQVAEREEKWASQTRVIIKNIEETNDLIDNLFSKLTFVCKGSATKNVEEPQEIERSAEQDSPLSAKLLLVGDCTARINERLHHLSAMIDI